MHTRIHTYIPPAPPHEATAIIRRVCNPRRRVISRLMPAYLSLSCTCTHVTRPRHAYLILPLGCTSATLYAAYVRTYVDPPHLPVQPRSWNPRGFGPSYSPLFRHLRPSPYPLCHPVAIASSSSSLLLLLRRRVTTSLN